MVWKQILPSDVVIKKKRILPKLPCTRAGCCNRTFPTQKTLQDHVDFKNGTFHNVCDYVKCVYMCETASHLVTHKKTHDLELKIPCGCCVRLFTSPSALQKHEDFVKGIIHNRCDHIDANGIECNYTCEEASALVAHKKTHDWELKIPCTCCNRRFPSLGKLRAHERFENGVFDNVCDYIDADGEQCGFQCEKVSDLKDHRLRHHTADDDPERIAMYERENARQRERYATDPAYRLMCNMHSSVRDVLKMAMLKKNGVYMKIPASEVLAHLNNNDRGYVYGDDETFGKLHIDHIRPKADVMKGCMVDALRISSIYNLQLLPWRENLRKRDAFTRADRARYALDQGKVIEEFVPGWIADGVCACVRCVPVFE
jgi:hypothetical protein